MALNFNSDEQSWPSKGKCVTIDHYLFDELWNTGDKKMPVDFKLEEVEGEMVDENETGEEQKETEIEEEKKETE
jgi:hypothetical protein